MIIIGEKINGTIPSVKQAIAAKNKEFIHDLALKQGQAGAAYLDVCAGTAPELEAETLAWLIDIVQQATDTPISIDSPNPHAIAAVFNCVKRPGLINSVSLEGDKCEVIFPLIEGTPWQVVALTCDNDGIPKDVLSRVRIAVAMVEKAQAYAITPDRIHIDPLVTALPADNQSLLNFAAAARQVRELYPDINVTSGLSNISFGLPLRKIINQNFLALGMFAGMNSAILDPLNRDIIATILAVEALLGHDRHCRNYANAYRQNTIGPVKGAAD
ncbi:methyltetrahydrofolate cobalamin methyltransferase [Desulfitobacterium chlororespirans]|uniref:5-methyltetrahydrofolate--homocysteine methyltransferase n=1 Tax=Desulfitobacterium chlororespirans DSM 11544 TaxID=1121395 RepID=A0A1M7RZW8_9FIRM|nr:methyltetrahydrofolate cobalamin methyltransferase [Desulfitobacterium chlororespirans]SHN51803.1 5-methyltetrahydrofolate--homocysteine methyltransferase [Desulfitobacterium chlororespirans DSM 11544]